jgi:hypothetical protein
MTIAPLDPASYAYSGAAFQAEALARTVECTRCHAHVGWPCVGPLGVTLIPGHYARIELAREFA